MKSSSIVFTTVLFTFLLCIFQVSFAIGDEWEQRPKDSEFYRTVNSYKPYTETRWQYLSPVKSDRQAWAVTELSDHDFFEVSSEEAATLSPYNFVIYGNLRFFVVRALGIPHRHNVTYQAYYFDGNLVIRTFVLGTQPVSRVAMLIALPEKPKKLYVWAGGAQ
jgi:hypothetical protein